MGGSHAVTSHLCFDTYQEATEGRRTVVVLVRTRRYEDLGLIKWHSPWRRYCFFPMNATLYDATCLQEIAAQLQQMNTEHRRSRRRV